MRNNRLKYSIAMALGCMLFSNTAFAISDPDVRVSNDAGIQMNRMRQYLERERVNRQIAEERAKAKSEVDTQGIKQTEQGDVISFELKKIVTDPSVVLTDAELDTIIKPYEGKQVELSDIYAIVNKINALYSEKGYVTCRAFLPQQTISDGIVKLMLVEGRTGTTVINGNTHTKSKYITNRLHLQAGDVANVKQLNKDMLLFNATNSTQLRIVMKAGALPNTTDYEITAYEPRQFGWTLMEDNAGSYSSGAYRTGLFFNTASLSGLCDSLSVGTIYSEGTKAGSAMYSRSIGRSGTKLNLLYNSNSVKTVKGTDGYDVLGHASSYTVGIVQPLAVTDKLRSELSLEYNKQDSKSDFRTSGTRFNIVDDSVQDFTLGYALTNYGDSHVLFQKHSYVFGNSDSTPVMSQANSIDYGFYKLNFLYKKLYQAGQMINVRADAQWSSTKGMVSSRQFYMGGMYSVRGYKESFIGGDSGYVLSAEYQMPLIDKTTSCYTFFDYGHVYSNGQSADADRILAGAGLGVRTLINNKYSADLSVAFPLHREFQSEKVSKARLHFIVSAQF